MIGIGEVILIIVLALVLFGPQKIPEIARLLGKAYREVQRFYSDVTHYIYGGEEGEAKSKPKVEHVEEAREILRLARIMNVIKDINVEGEKTYETLYRLLKGLTEK